MFLFFNLVLSGIAVTDFNIFTSPMSDENVGYRSGFERKFLYLVRHTHKLEKNKIRS